MPITLPLDVAVLRAASGKSAQLNDESATYLVRSWVLPVAASSPAQLPYAYETSGYVSLVNAADSLVSRSSVVAAPGEVLTVMFGLAFMNSAARSSAVFSASVVWPVHQVMVTFALGS